MKSIHADPNATALVADMVKTSVVDGPGNRFVLFLQGCNFDCVACHNPQTIPGHRPVEGYRPQRLTVDQVLDEIRSVEPFIRGITVSGGEATQQPQFLLSLFVAVKADPVLRRLSCLVDSNGACQPEVWDAIAPVMDGAMIDLKSFDRAIHLDMTGKPNDQVLASISHLNTLDRLSEVRLLIVDGLNDDPALIDRTGQWLSEVNPTMNLTIIGFRLTGTRAHDPPLREPSNAKLNALAERLVAVSPFSIRIV